MEPGFEKNINNTRNYYTKSNMKNKKHELYYWMVDTAEDMSVISLCNNQRKFYEKVTIDVYRRKESVVFGMRREYGE